MAISLVFGRNRLEGVMTSGGLLKAMELSIRLYKEFKKEFRSVKCYDVQKKLFGLGEASIPGTRRIRKSS